MVGHQSRDGEKPTAAKQSPDAPPLKRPDLERLSRAEREVLQLLTEGHTSKSIASLTDRTVAAVNERLREARRKTGISSSRELARLLKAQKARDEELGVASTACLEPGTGIETAVADASGTRRIGAIVMATIVIAGIAFAAFGTQILPSSSIVATPMASVTSLETGSDVARADPLLGPLEPAPQVVHLHGQVRSELRDAVWAARAETALRARFEPLSHSDQLEEFRVFCASTICEIAGVFAPKKINEINAAMMEIQDLKLDEPLSAVGLKRQVASFSTRRDTRRAVFSIYWLRSDP
jgi:DNA-binding CsgD family transcriptional regulator